MADLSNEDRWDIWANWMRQNVDPVSIDKNQLRTAFNEMDTFISNNLSAIMNAVSEPAQSGLSSKQKAHIFYLIVQKRWENA